MKNTRRAKVARINAIKTGGRSELDRGDKIVIEGRPYPHYPAIAIAYAEAVYEEKIPAGRLLRLACKRFLDMHAIAQREGGEYYWSNEHAVEPCAFIERLTHVKGVLAKKRIVLEPWQIWVICAIYGFRWSDTGHRVVTTVLLEVTRKSGKSLLAAGLALYELGPNANFGDDLFIIAPKEDQAKKVLEPMTRMIANDPQLRAHYRVRTTAKQMTFDATESYAVTLSAVGEKQDGHDPKVVIADEFHALPASIYAVMKSSQGARPESLFLQIGSAGRNTFGVGWDERNDAIAVLENKKSRLEVFVAIFAIDTEDFGRWNDERVIRKANPNAGVSTPMRKVRQEIEEMHGSPLKRAEIMRTRFGIWGLGETTLISAEAWDACRDTSLSLDDFTGRQVWLGADLASRNDMVALVALFEDGERLIPFARHYVPAEGPWIEEEEVRDLYIEWQRQGHLTFCPGSYHSYDDLLADIIYFNAAFDLAGIVVDDREANALMSAAAKYGIEVQSMRKNAANFSEPTKDIVARAVGKYKGIAHDGNPVLAWNVQNVIAGTDTAGLILPKKPSPHSMMKIDGFDAMVQCNAARMNTVPSEEEDAPNPMAAQGIRVFGHDERIQ